MKKKKFCHEKQINYVDRKTDLLSDSFCTLRENIQLPFKVSESPALHKH